VLRVGLTGGLASGKSFVGQTLEELGCLWIRADRLGHRVLDPGGAAHDAVVAEFGCGILKDDGSIDRRKLAAEVFHAPARLEKLNSLVHPPVIQMEEDLIADFAVREPGGIAVVEAAILVETGRYKRFDRLIVTYCSEEVQIERALRREGATRDEITARIRRQLPLDEKVKVADFVVDTSASKENTVEQVKRIYDSLRSIAS
jgi:dephospho-CoA kinase